MGQMLVPTLVMVGIAVALVLFTYFRQPAQLTPGLKSGGTLLLQIVPLLLAAFVVVGLVQVLIPKELIAKWIGEESGWKGILIGCAAGALTPGAPYAVFPIIGGFYKAGASIGAVVAFVAAWSLWQVTRIPVEVAFLGPGVTMIRVSLP